MTLSDFAWAMISAATVRPSVDFRSPPSPASRTSLRVTLSPASPASFSTTILSPAATRYCLPPVRTIANMGLFQFNSKCLAREAGPRTGSGAATEEGRFCQPNARRKAGLVPPLGPQLVAAAGKGLEHALD